MGDSRRARDHDLLDAIGGLDRVDRLDREAVTDTVWRVVRSDRDPLLCHASGGRWDSGRFDVLYTALAPDGAVAEMYFHLSRQPVFPSKVDFVLAEIAVTTRRSLRFAELSDLAPLGVDAGSYTDVLYRRTQEIGDAAAFLGFDGLIAPNARWDCQNLTLFSAALGPDDLALKGSTPVDWDRWRRSRKSSAG